VTSEKSSAVFVEAIVMDITSEESHMNGHPLIARRRLLANQLSTFRENVR
jgi:hypothetical protein